MWKSIDSILNQTFQNFELIIIDNHSTDKTIDIIDSFKDERISVITQSKGDLASALNEGLANASGNFIARQDADDYSSINRFSIQIEYLKRDSSINLVGSYFHSIDTDGIVLKEHKPPQAHEEIISRLLHHMVFAGPSILGRRDFFNELDGYDDHFDGYLGEDYDFVVRASEKGRLATVPRFLYHYRTNNPDSMCGKVNYNYEPYQKMVQKRAIGRGNKHFLKTYGG